MSTASPAAVRANSPRVYAELLPNIRQIVLFISFPQISSNSSLLATTSITLSPGRTSVSVSISPGESGNIQTQTLQTTCPLPAPVAVGARHILAAAGTRKTRQSTSSASTATSAGNGELAFRLPLDPIAQSVSRGIDHLGDYDYIPWTAKQMSPCARVRCRACGSTLLGPEPGDGSGNERQCGDSLIWKDLPSADWAEMMELWHCHKPHPEPEPPPEHGASGDGLGGGGHHHVHEHGHSSGHGDRHAPDSSTNKGYAATNRVACAPGTVLVDVASFVAASENCRGVRLKESQTRKNQPSKQGKVCLFSVCRKCLLPCLFAILFVSLLLPG